MRAWIGPLAFCLFSCGGSTSDDTSTDGENLPTTPEITTYIDSAPQANTDGQKLVFLSQRDQGAFRVYQYNESAEPKLKPLSQGIPLESGLAERATSLADDGKWILTWRYGTEKNYLLLNSFDQPTQQITLNLDPDALVRELTVAPSSQRFFAYTERKAGVDSVHIYSFTETTPPTLTEEIKLDGESGAQFAVVGSDVYVFTRKPTATGDVSIQYRKRSGPGAWSLQAETLTLDAVDAGVRSAASARGLFYAKSLDTVRLKAKLGTFAAPADDKTYQRNVGVSQDTLQFAAFSATPVDFSAELYRTNQPLTVGHISATADGKYLLLTGYDAWFCKTRGQPSNVMLLMDLDSGAILPLLPSRLTGTLPWTGVAAEPCTVFDESPVPKADFDTTVTNAQILSVTGNRVTLIYESRYTIDREIRRLVFDVSDWAAKTYASPVFTEISANTR